MKPSLVAGFTALVAPNLTWKSAILHTDARYLPAPCPGCVPAQPGGGIVIKRSGDGLCLGAVGVSGAPTAEQDEEIGRAAVRAMGL